MKGIPSLVALASLLVLTACSSGPVEKGPASLANAFDGAFLVGGALGAHVFNGESPLDSALAATHFNTITAENVLKWGPVHPEAGRYDFEPADQFVAFGEAHDQFIVGHTLVWHSQTPAWVFEDDDGNPLDREALLARMKDHIETVAGRYRGRIDAWDVVNEALNDDGSLRQTPWLRIIGEDYLVKAFEYAEAAAPDAELYYNDYSMTNPAKRAGAMRLVRSLQEAGVRIDGVGAQGHYTLETPTAGAVDSSITDLASLGIKVMITELDADVLPRSNSGAEISQIQEYYPELNPYTDGLTDEAAARLADRYREFFEIYVRHADKVDRVTFWGVSDGGSWLNYWPVRGRTNHALLFDRDGQPKRAFEAVMGTASVR
ncbi:MAG: endo-1,4-beta-xylanase [Rhodothermales bacterium]|nr:endo-1,4-beta-xylanase [Rhodothermales bacterium]